jgi:hypothetical protein
MIPRRFAGDRMKRFVEGADRGQSTLFPAVLGEDNPVRVINTILFLFLFKGLRYCFPIRVCSFPVG